MAALAYGSYWGRDWIRTFAMPEHCAGQGVKSMPQKQSHLLQSNLFIYFFRADLWHKEVPRLGSNWSCSFWPVWQPYSTAGSLTHWVRPGIWIHILVDTGQIRFHWATRWAPILNFFRTVLGSQQNWAEGKEIFHVLLSRTCTVCLYQHSPPVIFVIAEEPVLTHHYRLESIVNTWSHPWWCTVYGFGQIYNDIFPL